MTLTVSLVRFVVDAEAKGICDDLNIATDPASIADAIEFMHEVPDALIEHGTGDAIVEFIGLNPEHLIHLEPQV